MHCDCLLAEFIYCIHYLELELHCIDTINSPQENNENNVKLRIISISTTLDWKIKKMLCINLEAFYCWNLNYI